MSKLWSVVKNELYRYFISPLAYVYLLAFLFLNASFTLYLGHFLERGEACLDIMFSFMPWIFLIFISGISMRLWAEEFKTKTIMQLLSLPISSSVLVWGKFCAAWIFCTIGLLLTFPFVITVNILGYPDNGVIAAGYLSCFLLSGAMIAVAQTMSAITKNQVIALVLSVILNLLFFLSGIEYVLGFFRTFLPFELVESIANLSFLTNFNDLCQGQISAYSILFFISVICIFNFITNTLVRFKTSEATSWYRLSFLLPLIFLWFGFIGFNFLTQNILQTTYADVTQDKRFTLSDSAKKILSSIQEPITVKIYYSNILSQRNPLFRKAINRLSVLMKAYHQQAGDKLTYRFYHPEFLDGIEDMALHDHITPIPLPDLNQNAFFGLSFVDEGGRQKNIPFVAIENIDKLGTDILQNIYELSLKKKTVGIITSLPIFGLDMGDSSVSSHWQLIDEIKKLYQIKPIANAQDLKDINVLLLIHPQDLSQELTTAITHYTLHGGKILILADLATEAQRIYSPVNQRLTPSNFNGLNTLWGFDFNPDVVIADLDNSITVNTGSKKRASFAQDVIQFTVDGNGINRTQNETKYLSQFLFASTTPITPLPNHSSTFIPLLTTSVNSALLPSAVVYENINPVDILPQFKSDNLRKIIAAKIISNNKNKPFEVIVIGDTDFAYDDFWSNAKFIDDLKYLVFINDNINFVMNALDSLTGQTSLIELRHIQNTTAKFDTWEKLRKQNALVVSAKERDILAYINELKFKLNDLWQKKNFEERQKFSDDELTIIADYRKTLTSLKQQLADLRFRQNENIDHKKGMVVFFTLYAIPLILIIFLCIYTFLHRQKAKYKIKNEFHLTRCFVLNSGICLILFISGLLLVLSGNEVMNDFENRPVFPEWKTQLNQIQEIKLSQGGRTLTFYKQDGLWKIKNFENYPVYQRRIANLLAVLSNARYLERKSARAEYLPKFGLDISHATQLTLIDGEGRPILDFNIGKYDQKIGRGGRGAFLKFTNRFQVWLIDADFISLSPDWREWTLNTALNPRFGRLKDTDQIKDKDIQVLLVKELQNTPLLISDIKEDSVEAVYNLTLVFENDDEVTMYFEKSQNKYFIRYTFGKTEGDYLRLFADYAKNQRYEVPEKNMENLNNVFNLFN